MSPIEPPVLTRRAFCGGVAIALNALSIATPAFAGAGLVGTRHDGTVLTPGLLAGWKLVYFGYTHCPDVCPTGLQTITEALDLLGSVGERITPVFVTVDPARDTPAAMQDYVGFFHARMVGITPSPEQLQQMTALWRIKYAKAPGGTDGGYLMDHTSTALLISPQDDVAGRLSLNLAPEHFADRVKARLLASAPE